MSRCTSPRSATRPPALATCETTAAAASRAFADEYTTCTTGLYVARASTARVSSNMAR